ncbi:PepSY domain-containing protein [Pokkaliibacter sp. CJK22405]|uniref:PepSY domain-containing protein n=1 Tax=Pokkaliibacter sp. CJK22405 TaxID=3384615 RepID=UPI003984DB64
MLKHRAVATYVAAVLFSGGGMAEAEAGVTPENIQRTALDSHPGKLRKAVKVHKGGLDVWQVEIHGKDDMDHTLFYNAENGRELSFS